MTTSSGNKSRITELRAAALWHERILRRAQAEWPEVYQRFRMVLGDGFRVQDEQMAQFDLALAALALDLQAVKNLFPADQANRIESWVEKLLDTPDWGEYALSEVRDYGRQFQKEVETIEKGSDPISVIPARLLRRWLGEDIRRFDLEIGSKKTGFIDPILISLTVEKLMPFAGTWKSIGDQYELVEEDFSTNFDWETYGLYDPGKYPENKKPDGTIIFPDNDGKTTERWLHPRMLARLLSGGEAKRIGMVCRVMVKGPWGGIKETRLQLSDESVNAFVDGSGCAYALCEFRQGQPSYQLTKKTVWEKTEQAVAIMSNTELTDDQRAAALKRLLKD
jgi:hypothetical protein